MKIKLLDSFGNVQLDEDGCVQFSTLKLAKEKVLNGQHYAIHVKENEEGIIIDVWHRNGELINSYTYWNDDVDTHQEYVKSCAICKLQFTINKNANTADDRTLCEECRIATAKLK